MSFITIILIALALAMDSFAVALSIGITMCKMQLRFAFRIAAFFGIFQAIMPITGWCIGRFASECVNSCDHWIAFLLLEIIGGKMIYEAIRGNNGSDEEKRDPHNVYILLTLALATSIDAAAVGISLSFLNVAIMLPSIIIGVITFFVSLAGVAIGCRAGSVFGDKIEILGGIVLIGLGIKILIQNFF